MQDTIQKLVFGVAHDMKTRFPANTMEKDSSKRRPITLNPHRFDLTAQKNLELLVDNVMNECKAPQTSQQSRKKAVISYELVEMSENDAIRLLKFANCNEMLSSLEDDRVLKRLFSGNPFTRLTAVDWEYSLYALIGGNKSCYDMCTNFTFSKNTRGANVFIAHYLNRANEATVIQFYRLQSEKKLAMDVSPEYWFAIFIQSIERNDNNYFLLTSNSFNRMKGNISFITLVQVQHQLCQEMKQSVDSSIQKQKRFSIETIIKLVDQKFLPDIF